MALELGPCGAYFGTAGAEVSLGKTSGGVTVKLSDSSVDLKSDQYGEAPEDTVISGTTVEVTLSLAEITLPRLNEILQAQNSSPNDGFVAGENKTGTSLLGLGQSLLLKKYVNGSESADKAEHITFPCAAPLADVELSYDAANQRVLSATFKCFPKLVTSYWGTVAEDVDKTIPYWFGDETVTS